MVTTASAVPTPQPPILGDTLPKFTYADEAPQPSAQAVPAAVPATPTSQDAQASSGQPVSSPWLTSYTKNTMTQIPGATPNAGVSSPYPDPTASAQPAVSASSSTPFTNSQSDAIPQVNSATPTDTSTTSPFTAYPQAPAESPAILSTPTEASAPQNTDQNTPTANAAPQPNESPNQTADTNQQLSPDMQSFLSTSGYSTDTNQQPGSSDFSNTQNQVPEINPDEAMKNLGAQIRKDEETVKELQGEIADKEKLRGAKLQLYQLFQDMDKKTQKELFEDLIALSISNTTGSEEKSA